MKDAREIMAKQSLLVVNLHGLINTPGRMRETLIELGIGKRLAATIVSDDETTVGALKLCKDYVAWNTIDEELLTSLLQARGRVSNSKMLDADALKAIGFEGHSALASKIVKDGSRLSSVQGVKPFFGLSPPRGGFKRSTRRQFKEGGVLGENPMLADLVRRMF
jgi:large subunit ribosomal protein L30